MLVLSDLHRREVGPEEAQYLIDLIYTERLLALLQFPDEAQAYARFFREVGLCQRVLPAHLFYIFR